MVALRTIHFKSMNRAFKILEGREIPKQFIQFLDIKRLISEGAIKDDKVPNKGKPKESFTDD